jgi:hypothetical protein
MASGFTRPNEQLSRSGLTGLVGKIKSGQGAALNNYAKASMTKKAGVQPASGSKLRKF